MADPHDTTHAADHGLGHVLPPKLLLGTFAALLALTALTVATGKMDLMGLDLAVAMIIATIKATLVAMIFMHLKWDRPFNGLVFLISILFVGLFLALAATDVGAYQGDINRYQAENPLATPGEAPGTEPAAVEHGGE
ncbi:MAG: cytochrome C oxidase subunit IV family protein [Planctomycetes bacterium]|nr:cytochrome C oxidase subunit IV family protein [Planctomycetota bacterium]MBL7008623.1 cytochrome C oxidase subunit IV family protein [Planctomycetota bacterium]